MSPSCEAATRSATQEFRNTLWNANVRYCTLDCVVTWKVTTQLRPAPRQELWKCTSTPPDMSYPECLLQNHLLNVLTFVQLANKNGDIKTCCCKLSFIHQTYNTHTDTHLHCYTLTKRTSYVCPSYNTGTDPIQYIVYLHCCVHDYHGNIVTLVTMIHNNHSWKLVLITTLFYVAGKCLPSRCLVTIERYTGRPTDSPLILHGPYKTTPPAYLLFLQAHGLCSGRTNQKWREYTATCFNGDVTYYTRDFQSVLPSPGITHSLLRSQT
jgi:hypothetical protein